ncbi:MAG: cardiolipin synthase B [Chloracidobacterium sp.]|nr:cardiolipin synthase B [Chloracidobacterium sp.]
MRPSKTSEPKARSIDLPVMGDSGDLFSDSLERVTGARLIRGNDVRLLIDATENYPAWLDAIESAERRILFETYIIHNDEQGEIFANKLIEKAKQGVEVKVIYDWLGAFGKSPRRYWRHLREGGAEVRCYNPPKLLDPLALVSRDHRKTLVVDGRIAFVSGLCVGQMWVGDPEAGTPPWRDTGVELTGPAVAEVESAFAEVWATMGPPIELTGNADGPRSTETGGVAVRIVKSSPGASYIYRLDQMLGVTARETMWISDAYFVGVPSYMQTLKDASEDGVDVRILVPQSTDIGLIRDTTRSTYRPLLEAGIRVFEWNGSMMHAKTAVFDGKYSRVGSTNLNIASWFGNYELDVFVEDEDFARQMEAMFLRDLEGSTEIVLSESDARGTPRRAKRFRRTRGGSVSRATAGALNAASSIGSALRKQSVLGPAEARILVITGSVLVGFALLLLIFPRAASIPIAVLLLILAIPALTRAIKAYRKHG